jgi:hypothetical protein
MIKRLLIFLIIALVLVVFGLLAYSYSGLLRPEQTEIIRPVDLNIDLGGESGS